ncbi:MAG: hypothetical protein IIZ39_08465 [Blautia sp.]|nr:hypothetical protein [Blautia sp.]
MKAKEKRNHLLLTLLAVFVLSLLMAIPSFAASASITAEGFEPGVIKVTGRISSTVKSKDNKYYLFEVDPYSGDLVKAHKSTNKASSVTFLLSTEENMAYAQLKYALAVKTGSGTSAKDYTRISPAVFVVHPERCATLQTSYIYPATKKGLQSADLNAQVDTASKNCFVNLVVFTFTTNPNITFTYNGKTYHYNSFWGFQQTVKACNQRGISVTAQVMLNAAAPKSFREVSGGDAPFYAFNTKNRDARQSVDALFAHLARFFGREDCYISNWILGNEVNSVSPYYYMGNVSLGEFVRSYAATFRSFYNALRSVRSSARVFTCLEHCWTIPNGYAVAFPGKDFLEAFDKELKSLQKDVQWNLAYHPYPDQLTDPDFWNDNAPKSENAPFICPKNLSALTNYIKKKFGKQTRVIISEIGFNSKPGQDVQAAALALAYDIAACNPMVDAFIIRSYENEAADAAYGLAFGIKGKKAFNVFKFMDTKSYSKYTKTILKKKVGKSWKNYISGFKAARLYSNYHY